MHRSLDAYDDISIAEIVVWAFLLIGAIALMVKHGLSSSAGWRFIIIVALARIIGSGMRLATISDPTNISLYVGWQVCNGLAIGPLVLTIMGLLTRVFEAINSRGHVVVNPTVQRGAQLVMVVGVILLIVGGVQSTYTMSSSGTFHVDYSAVSEAGMAISLVVYVFLLFLTFTAFRNQSLMADGEHRIVLAAVASLPFLLVREVYGCYLIFGDNNSSAWLLLGMAVLMEIAIAIICEGVGFTLGKVQPPADVEMVGENRQHKYSGPM